VAEEVGEQGVRELANGVARQVGTVLLAVPLDLVLKGGEGLAQVTVLRARQGGQFGEEVLHDRGRDDHAPVA